MLKKFLAISTSNSPKARSTFSSISEIPLNFNIAKLFGCAGFASGVSLVLIPNKYIETEICFPFPNSAHLSAENRKLLLLFVTCSSCYGYIGGQMYRYKMFKMGDYKRIYKVLNALVNKAPLTLLHCAAYPMIVYYGMFGVFTVIECLCFGKPYGMDDTHDKYHNYEYGSHRLLGTDTDKDKRKWNWPMLKYRALFGMEITAHWLQSTLWIVFPFFFCSSVFIFATHRSYWLSLLYRLKKP